jgi:hypothetical protein
MSWQHKAESIIAQHCRTSYEQANRLPNGRMRRRHVPYSVPPIAAALVDALNHDDEAEAKRLLVVERASAWSLI